METEKRKRGALKKHLESFMQYTGVFGCYAFFECELCLYVGKANCVYSRCKAHGLRFQNYTDFRCWPLEDEIKGMDVRNAMRYLEIIEAALISQYNPVENVKRPSAYSMVYDCGDAATTPARKRAAETIRFPGIMDINNRIRGLSLTPAQPV